MERTIFHLEHEGLTSNHLGVVKTYIHMCDRYFLKGLFQKIYNYVRLCQNCQQRKDPVDKDRPYHLRIPTDYKPFSVIYADIKHMFLSDIGNKYLLVVTCDITRYVEAIPISRCDAQTVTEALVRKIVLRYGSPSLILLDEAGCFLSQIAQSLWSVTNTKVKVISPYNHGSNVVERSMVQYQTYYYPI